MVEDLHDIAFSDVFTNKEIKILGNKANTVECIPTEKSMHSQESNPQRKRACLRFRKHAANLTSDKESHGLLENFLHAYRVFSAYVLLLSLLEFLSCPPYKPVPSYLMWSVFQTTKFTYLYLYTPGCRTIYWTMSSFSGDITLKKLTSLFPSQHQI